MSDVLRLFGTVDNPLQPWRTETDKEAKKIMACNHAISVDDPELLKEYGGTHRSYFLDACEIESLKVISYMYNKVDKSIIETGMKRAEEHNLTKVIDLLQSLK